MKKNLLTNFTNPFDSLLVKPTLEVDESKYPVVTAIPSLWPPCPGLSYTDPKYIKEMHIEALFKVIDEQPSEPEDHTVWPFPDPDLELPIVIPFPLPLPITQTFYRDSYGTLKLNDGATNLILLNEYMPREPEPGQFKFLFYTPLNHTPFQVEVLNTLLGNSLNNRIIGNQDNNRLDGAAGSDTMQGGKGDDLYVIDNAGDEVVELAGEGAKDKVQASVDYRLSSHVENLLLVGDADINGHGNELNNLIKGNVGNNLITGGTGDDSLRGNLGADTLTGGDGADTFVFSRLDFDGQADVITDFQSGTDHIEITNLIYPLVLKLDLSSTPWSEISAKLRLFAGDEVDEMHTGGALFSYNTSNGYLYFDHDGEGGDTAVHFATFQDAPSITADDIGMLNVYIPTCGVGDTNPYDFLIYA